MKGKRKNTERIGNRKAISLVLTALLGLFTIILLINLASSLELLCLSKGQQVRFSLCNPAMDDRTCGSDSGCQYCVSRSSSGAYCPANPNACNNEGLSCSSLDGNDTTIDSEPPVLTIINPVENEYYNSRSIQLILDVNEKASISYLDNINGKGKWTQVCNGCFGYNNPRSFKEGLNDLTFRARDPIGNTVFKNLTFRVDSEEPKIKSTDPTSGYASGFFDVNFEETSPTSLVLHYGNDISGFQTKNVDLGSINALSTTSASGECQSEGEETNCDTNVNLGSYNNQDITYWFELTDIAGSMASSKVLSLSVDTTPPVINNFNYNVSGKNAIFNLTITEQNFNDISYYDHLDSRAKWKKLCSSLKENNCVKKVSFKDGDHDVDIKVTDEAGNSVLINVKFFTDSKKPKIKSTSPSSGLTNGFFDIEFTEENPVSLVLHYGNDIQGYNEANVDLNSDCSSGKRGYSCQIFVNLNSYNNNEIDYWFVLKDKVNQVAESKPKTVGVDTTNPVINSLNYTLSGNKVTFVLDITELNFDEASMLDQSDPKAKERILCTSLKNNICQGKSVILNDDFPDHTIEIKVMDEAGNTISVNREISLV